MITKSKPKPHSSEDPPANIYWDGEEIVLDTQRDDEEYPDEEDL